MVGDWSVCALDRRGRACSDHPNGTGEGSVFGYASFPANLSLVTWTIATSVARYRTVTI
jgi:hypothetical protein